MASEWMSLTTSPKSKHSRTLLSQTRASSINLVTRSEVSLKACYPLLILVQYYANGPRLHEFLQDIYKQVLSKYDTITVGEMPFVKDDNEILRVVGEDRGELNMIFIFEVCNLCYWQRRDDSLTECSLSRLTTSPINRA